LVGTKHQLSTLCLHASINTRITSPHIVEQLTAVLGIIQTINNTENIYHCWLKFHFWVTQYNVWL